MEEFRYCQLFIPSGLAMIFLRALPYVTHYKPNLLMVESSTKM